MGLYINSENMTKEEWLAKYGQLIFPEWPMKDKDKVLICLVQNPSFSAAGVCYNEGRFLAFNWSKDNRPKKWFLVKKQDLPFDVRKDLDMLLGESQ